MFAVHYKSRHGLKGNIVGNLTLSVQIFVANMSMINQTLKQQVQPAKIQRGKRKSKCNKHGEGGINLQTLRPIHTE